MTNLSDFLPSSGGGGLTPKFEEFNSSGTFTPTQALIDAGGYIELFLVGGGAWSSTEPYGNGGEVLFKKMYLTSTSSITVTIGAGGQTNNAGGSNTVFSGSSAGGSDITARGGGASYWYDRHGSGFGGQSSKASGNGVLGYAAGGSTGSSGIYRAGPNTGHGSAYYAGGSGYCLIKWYE